MTLVDNGVVLGFNVSVLLNGALILYEELNGVLLGCVDGVGRYELGEDARYAANGSELSGVENVTLTAVDEIIVLADSGLAVSAHE